MSLPERIVCSACGKGVSTPVPAGTLVRAWVQCPECVEAEEASEEEALLSPHMCPHFCEPSECGTCAELAAARAEGFRDGAEAAIDRIHNHEWRDPDDLVRQIRALPLPEVPRG